MKKLINYFSKFEIFLWCTSVAMIISSHLIFDRSGYLYAIASVLGVTAILMGAKGNPIGQGLMVIFSLIYGFISFSMSYYGEMITYMGMTLPMSVFALISWLRNPFNGNHSQVEINRISKKETTFMLALTLAVTVAFYFILNAFGTANIIPSTVSVATSFAAVYLTSRRSPYFSLAYTLNDVVLIILWSLAIPSNISYVSMVVCFAMFLANDIYSFANWRKIEIRQKTKNN